MSVSSGATIWTIACDRPRCANQIAIAAASCSQALLDAENHGWQTKYDGTTLCPEHKTQKGPHR